MKVKYGNKKYNYILAGIIAAIMVIILIPLQQSTAFVINVVLPDSTTKHPSGQPFTVVIDVEPNELVPIKNIEIIIDKGTPNVKRALFTNTGAFSEGDDIISSLTLIHVSGLTGYGYAYGYGAISYGSIPYNYYYFIPITGYLGGNPYGYFYAATNYGIGYFGPSKIKIEGILKTQNLSAGTHTFDVLIHTDAGGNNQDKIVAPTRTFTVYEAQSSLSVSGSIITPGLGTTIGNVTSVNISTVSPPPTPPNAVSVNLPHGLISFTANTTPGQFAIIQIQYPTLPPLSSNEYFIYYKLVGGTWKVVGLNDTSNPNGYFTLFGTTVTLYIRDNGAFDADPAPGVVSDPGGIAVVTVTSPPVGGGAGGGGAVVIQPIQPTRTTVQPTLTLNVSKQQVSIDEQLTISGMITDDKGNRLDINGIVSITLKGRLSKVYTAELKNGEYSLTLDAVEVLRAVKSRDVSIRVSFNGMEVQVTPSRIVEYKAAENRDDVNIIADTIIEKVRVGKKAVRLTLDNFTDTSIAKITLNAEDGKIIVAKAKDFDRKRISMQDIELTIKKGKSITFSDIVKIGIVKEGKITYKVYDDTGRLIKEGRIE